MSDAASRGHAPGTVVRLPNHLGDVVMALPALARLLPAEVVVASPLADLVGLLPGARVLPLERSTGGMLRAAGTLRSPRRARGVLFTASFSSALLFALAGVRRRRGTATDGRTALLTERIPPTAIRGVHRAAAFWRIATGELPDSPPAPRLELPEALREAWRGWLPQDRPVVGLVPGGAASARRWDPDRFTALARSLTGDGVRIVVFGGPGERALTATVAGDAGLDMGGRTPLPLLAAGLAACDVVVSNDTGPLHLASAVGTRTVSLWGAGDPAVTRPLGAGHTLLRRADLPCVPCVRNTCPRTGAGYILPDAERECLRLIGLEEVVAAVRRTLG